MPRIRIIHWKPAEIREQVDRLIQAGYQVENELFSPDILRVMRETPPDAVLIDLSRLPSQGRDLGLNIRKTKATRFVPIVFLEGDKKKVDMVKETLPDAWYSSWVSIEDDLPDAIASPVTEPVVPDSVMAGYSGTTLPKKLGIKQGATVVLIDPPDGFERTLGEIPADVSLVYTLSADCDVTIWFNRSREAYERDIEHIGEIAGGGRLWILWPKKSSSVKSDLSQTIVRNIGLDSGLVDYKVAAIDDVWSGLCFTKRKK